MKSISRPHEAVDRYESLTALFSFLNAAGIEANHWSNLGAANALDFQIMDFAHAKDYIILTQDLDFGIMLATSNQLRPSVVQLRTDDVSPEAIGTLVITRAKTIVVRP